MSLQTMPKLSGLIPVLTTPFRGNQIDIPAFQQHITALLPYASGFVVGATTGESGSLSDDEILTLLQAARNTAGERILISGAWRATVKDALTCAQTITPYADVLLFPMPHELFHADDAAIEEFYLKIAAISNALLLYNYPARCANRKISAALATRLAQQSEKIIGIKDSSEDAELVTEIITKNLPLHAIGGNDRFLHHSHTLAHKHKTTFSTSSISGASSIPFIAAIEAEIYKLMQAGAPEQAEALQQQLTQDFFNDWAQYAQQLGGLPPIIKFLISTQIPDYPIAVRPPLHDILPEISQKLRRGSK
jgi:dihydrodipicolinate synthase/N-acetylneuraminate lyase